MGTRRNVRQPRAAYTLMEVVVALGIAVLILYGLYTAVDVQLRYAQSGRSVVELATLARALAARIAQDISPSIGLPDPGIYRQSQSQSGAGTSGGQGTRVTAQSRAQQQQQQQQNTTTNNTSNTTNASGTGTDTTGSTTTADLSTVLAVIGNESSLTLYVSRVPRELLGGTTVAGAGTGTGDDAGDIVSDQRCIVYWLGGGADSPLGLCRQEIPQATTTADANVLAQGTADEAKFIIAEEVRGLTFSYYDGTN